MKPSRTLFLLLYIAATIALTRAYLGAQYNEWPAADEYWHYSYSERLLNNGETERETTSHYMSTTPFPILNNLSVQAAERLGLTAGFSPLAARFPQLIWLGALLVTVFLFSRRFFGEEVAVLAAVLTASDQAIIGQASILGSDLPFACTFLWCVWADINYALTPTLGGAVIASVALVLSFSTKYLAIFSLPLLVFCIFWSYEKGQPAQQQAKRTLRDALAFLAVFIGLTSSTYFFHRFGEHFGSPAWHSPLFKTFASFFPNLPIPFPEAFITGFDLQFSAERLTPWNVVVLGNLYPDGRWFYFLVVWFFKTPAVSLVAALAGLGFLLWRYRTWLGDTVVWILLSSFVLLFFYFSFVFRTQVGQRYTLMCLPLFYLLAAVGWNRYGVKRAFLILLLMIVAGGVIESVSYWNNPISFTNSFLQPKKLTYRVLADSNVDWFQNYERSKAEARTAVGDYEFNPPHILKGKNLITLNSLAGVMFNFPQYQWVRENLTPVRQFGYTTFLFDVTDSQFNDFMNAERTVAPVQENKTLCNPRHTYTPLASEGDIELPNTRKNPSPNVLCIETKQDVDLEITAEAGSASIGYYTDDLQCVPTDVLAGATLALRLKAGMHALCAIVPESFRGRWKNPSNVATYAWEYLPGVYRIFPMR